jgi:hypothetical protein
MLNIALFEAVKRYGPLGVGVASNIKQAATLLFDFFPLAESEGTEKHVEEGYGLVFGTLITVFGGLLYAIASANMSKGERRDLTEQD